MRNNVMNLPTVGSIWTVAGVHDGIALVVAGPFGADDAPREFLITPLYTGAEPGFHWTDWDVCIDADESPFSAVRYAAIWNVRPILAQDLVLQVGDVTARAASAVRDVYWASLNGQTLGPDPRLGEPLADWRAPGGQFQKTELDRWAGVSGRVIAAAEAEQTVEDDGLLCHYWGALGTVAITHRVGGMRVLDNVVNIDALHAAAMEVHDYILPTPVADIVDQLVARLLVQPAAALPRRPVVTPIIDANVTIQIVPPSEVKALERESNRLASILRSMEAA